MNTAVKNYYTLASPKLLRGKERLLYLQKSQGAINPQRAKAILRDIAKARKSMDR